MFEETTENDISVWSFKAPPPPPPSALQSALSSLYDTLPGPSRDLQSIRNAYQSLSSFTGYLSTQLYSLPSNVRFTATGMSVLSDDLSALTSFRWLDQVQKASVEIFHLDVFTANRVVGIVWRHTRRVR